MRRSISIGLVCFCLAFSSESSRAQLLYWVDANFLSPQLGKSDLSGGNVSTMALTTKSLPEGLAIDAVHNTVYYGELGYVSGKVRKTTSLLAGLSAVDSSSIIRGITVDAAGAKIYWTTSNMLTGGTIMKANADGTSPQTLYSFAANTGMNLRGIVVSGSTLYWADYTKGRIQAGDITGSAPTDLITGLNGPIGIALGGDGNIYWTEAGSNTIRRRAIASGTVQTLVSSLSSPNYLAIEPASGKMFWTEVGTPKIKKADLAGTNVQVLPAAVSHPTGIAVTSSPLPIQLSAFSCSAVNGAATRIAWTTLSETNNYGFYVERQLPSEQSFSPLPDNFVAGHGSTVEPHTYAFIDNSVPRQGTWYRLKQVDLDGTAHFSDPIILGTVTGVAEQAPAAFGLLQNYPNPFNPSTTIRYALPVNAKVTLKVFDILGREVATLVNEVEAAGTHAVQFNADRMASGMYIYKLNAGPFAATKHMLLLK